MPRRREEREPAARVVTLSTSPVRTPDTRSPRLMAHRAWWLVGLNLLIPGSAQVLAGNRRLGRFGLAATLVLWALVVVGVVELDPFTREVQFDFTGITTVCHRIQR